MNMDDKYYGVGLAHLCRELNCSAHTILNYCGYRKETIIAIGEALLNRSEQGRVRMCYTTNVNRTRSKRVKFEGKRWIEKGGKALTQRDKPIRTSRKNGI